MASQLIRDDHGIVLIASRKNLEKHASTEGLDSDMNRALLAGMKARQLVGVGTDGGGMIQTVVQSTGREEAEKTTRAISQFGWTVFPQSQLVVDEDDEVLVLSFSAYTSYCKDRSDIVCADTQSWSFPVGAGLYDVYFGHLLESDDVDSESGVKADRSVWFLLVEADDARELSLESLPGTV